MWLQREVIEFPILCHSNEIDVVQVYHLDFALVSFLGGIVSPIY